MDFSTSETSLKSPPLKYLKTLLLERNPIKMLPVELGNVRTLRALNLRCCPVEFPPQLVVQKGPAAILSFLRACAAEPAPHATSPPEKMTPSQLPHPHWDLPKECAPNRETTDSQGPEGSRLAEAGDLSELRRCPRPCEDWPTEGELRRFWKLRQEIVEKEQAEVLESQLLAVELPPNLRAMLHGRKDARPGPKHTPRRTAPSSRGAQPGLASAYLAVSWAGQLEERRAAALRELQEKQALTEQRRRDQRVLQEWREQAQATKRKKEELGRLRPPRQMLVALEVPFATDLPGEARAPANPPGQRVQSRERSLRASDTPRAGHQGALEERLRRHLRQAPEQRRTAFGGTVPLGAIRKAAEASDTARKLQDKVEVMKQKPGPP
ncbi:leucine-rich repeat-containing protein 27 isoform X1 [Sturnira hondurensis]|uniref:leucine-rich repeat-containing protein 27 isoform X1 n=1 Tax=Sturnira hondurensis TaxID=192404 RepID=UPI001879DA02|nr:leucine-rich repeat-containing protein 27 isoform X1 [Sturnira hondurensis]XP_036907137.1 leucine-rich repeat-containing protein 27 isoform X1 [Sturnira hondurensis]